ncbi:unnamed protein product [Rotaria sp. Silwood1]|nr:unnamed protein product [Rotaria sp. Silwood1]
MFEIAILMNTLKYLHLCSDWPIGFLVHEILESTSNYNIAVEQLAQSPIIAPCYFTICGTSQCKTIETLITRKQTSEENRLIEIWQEIFATQLLDIMSVIQCPIVFGVMRRSAGEKGWPLISEYEFKLLLKDDILIQTQEKLTREAFLRELIIFKEEFDHNEQLLSLNFMTKTGLCWDIILEIAKYLTLNDAVEAFSDKILFLLRKYKTKVHLSYSSNRFINMILRTIDYFYKQ